MLAFSVVTDIKECEKLWKMFSSNEHLFDVWEYRACFFDKENFQPHFIVGKNEGEIIGVLPLWKSLKQGYYEFFGGEFAENNKFFIKDRSLLPDFLGQIPSSKWLVYIDESEFAHINKNKLLNVHLAECDKRYYLDLSEYGHSLDEYIGSFSKKHRKNLKRDLKSLLNLNYKLSYNNAGDFKMLCELNIARFGKKSFFFEEWFVKGFERLIKTAIERKELQMIGIEVGGRIESIEAAVLHNGIYAVLLGGNNLQIDNIGKLITIEHIKNAVLHKAKIVDFLSTDCQWKKLWNLKEEPVYEYTDIKDEEEIHEKNETEPLIFA